MVALIPAKKSITDYPLASTVLGDQACLRRGKDAGPSDVAHVAPGRGGRLRDPAGSNAGGVHDLRSATQDHPPVGGKALNGHRRCSESRVEYSTGPGYTRSKLQAFPVGSQRGAMPQHPVTGGAPAGVRARAEGHEASAFAGPHAAFSDRGSGSGHEESEPLASHRHKHCAATIRTQEVRQRRNATGRRRRGTSFSRSAICNAASILPVLASIRRQPSSAGLARQTAQERAQAKLTQAR